MNSDDEIILSHMFDRIMERFDKLESRMDANDRRLVQRRFRSPQELDHEDQPRTRNKSCWGPPPGRSHQGYSYQHTTRLRSCHKQPLRQQPSSLRRPTRWDMPGQQGYQPHEPPARMEPPDCIFRPLPQPPQPHCCQNAADEERYLGEVITHTHSPKLAECLDSYVCGYAHELRDQDEDDSSSSSLVAPIGYSCENTRDFDYYSKCRMVEEEHCENLGNMLLMDSKSETEVEEVCGADASNSDATGVSISSIALLDEKHGVEEDRAVSPADHQVSASKEIYWSCSSDVNNILSTAPLPAAALLSDVDGDFKCLLQGLLQLDLLVQDAQVCKWRRSPFDDRISPPMLIFYGGDEGRSSVVRCVFDPGGDTSPKLLLSTLRCFVVSTLRTRWILTVGELLRAFNCLSLV